MLPGSLFISFMLSLQDTVGNACWWCISARVDHLDFSIYRLKYLLRYVPNVHCRWGYQECLKIRISSFSSLVQVLCDNSEEVIKDIYYRPLQAVIWGALMSSILIYSQWPSSWEHELLNKLKANASSGC